MMQRSVAVSTSMYGVSEHKGKLDSPWRLEPKALPGQSLVSTGISSAMDFD